MGIYNLNCTGNETTLWDCQFNTSYNGGNCGQSNDASVFCMRKILLTLIIVVKFVVIVALTIIQEKNQKSFIYLRFMY